MLLYKKKNHTEIDLLVLANDQKVEGKTDIAPYILNNINKAVKIIQNHMGHYKFTLRIDPSIINEGYYTLL